MRRDQLYRFSKVPTGSVKKPQCICTVGGVRPRAPPGAVISADEERLSQKIVSLGPDLDSVEGVTQRFFGCYCCPKGSLTGSSHAHLQWTQEPPELSLLGQPLDMCRLLLQEPSCGI